MSSVHRLAIRVSSTLVARTSFPSSEKDARGAIGFALFLGHLGSSPLESALLRSMLTRSASEFAFCSNRIHAGAPGEEPYVNTLMSRVRDFSADDGSGDPGESEKRRDGHGHL